ncbi:MAG: dihydroorotase [Deltaproteobacteria bacterium]|nr:dihydroorotase [Deltaproteobacteria bacterium]
MIDLAITGGRVLDPVRTLDVVGDVLIDDGKIMGVAAPGEGPRARAVVDAAGLWVTPGMIDMHVHLREPGGEHKETIASGAAAAVAGGFTTVAAMANTDPVNDDVEVTRWIRARAAEVALARVLPIAAVTKGLAGEELTDFAALRQAGAVAFSDDGMPIMRESVMQRALAAAAELGAAIIAHEEDCAGSAGAVMHAGPVAARLGMRGVDAAGEAVMIARDCVLAAALGARLHVAHVSTAAGIAHVRRARAGAKGISAEATPHHFMLDASAVERHGANAKMNPPLRDPADVEAVRAALADGTIAVIASDHAPHHADEKARGLEGAPFGIVGLETALGLTLALVHAGVLSAATAVRALTLGPARVLGLPGGQLTRGAAADVSLLDPELRWRVDPAAFRSRSRNTPFAGVELRGRAVGVCIGGRLIGNFAERLCQ